MADTQNEIYAQAYGRNIMQLAQQKYSKLRDTVYIRPDVRGKTFFQDQIGEWELSVKGGRNAVTPNNDPNLIGRKYDDVILGAMHAAANYGETGSLSLTNGNEVLVTASSMTLERVATIKKTLDDKDVEVEDRYFVANTTLLNNLLRVTEATSADYNSVKALIRGEIDTWMGFKWIMTTRIPDGFVGFAFQKYGVCLAEAASPFVRADQRPDLSYSWQVYYEVNIGAVRLEENKVVVIKEG